MTMEKVLEGIAAIIQALPTDEDKAQVLERILDYLRQQAIVARDEAARDLSDAAYSRSLLVLRCIASIGKGLRTENEVVLEPSDSGNGDSQSLTFWNSGRGADAQSLIIQSMRLPMTEVPRDASTIEAACDILKAGFTEKAGPYVFPPMVAVSFVKSIHLGSAGTDMVMGTAPAFLASHSAHPEHIREETVALIVHVYESICRMQEMPGFMTPKLQRVALISSLAWSRSTIPSSSRLLLRRHHPAKAAHRGVLCCRRFWILLYSPCKVRNHFLSALPRSSG
jgi:hypothetical protein